MSKCCTKWYERKLVKQVVRNNWGANSRDFRSFAIEVRRYREVDYRARCQLYYRIDWDKNQIPEGGRLVNVKINRKILELNNPWIDALLALEKTNFLQSNMTKKEFFVQVALGLDPLWIFACPASYQEIKRVAHRYHT